LPTDRIPGRSTRRQLSIALIVLGALLLMIMPTILLFFSFASKSGHLPGTLVILSSAGGMAFILVGAALRD